MSAHRLTGAAGAARTFRILAQTALRADRRGSLLQVALAVLNATNVAAALGLKLLVDAVEEGDAGKAMTGAAVIAGLGIVSRSANNLGARWLATTRERTDLLIDQEIMALAGSVPGIEHYERPAYANELDVLRSQRSELSNALPALVQGMILVARSILTLVLLAALHPVLVLLPAFCVPSVVLAARGQRIEHAAEEAVAERQRLLAHLFQLATTAEPGKELRVFGLQEEVRERYLALTRDVQRTLRRARSKVAVLTTLGWLVFAVGFVGAIVLVTVRAVRGDASAGDVVLAFSLAGQLNGQAAQAVGTVAYLLRSLKVAGRLVWLQDYAAAAPAGGATAVPERLTDGITFDGVSFRYPGTDHDVLVDVDLHVPAGTTLAIVGDNGAGKSTLVKLLCRLYEPTDGTIRVDGVDLAELSVTAWRERLSGAFQDFTRFELRARQTVGVGDLDRVDDDVSVGAALQRAAAADVVDGLSGGLETQLGKSFTDGAELSGGQWQKLALARGLMRPAPLVLVLDEPTAALDAEAEHALFERYASAARAAGATSGAVTVLVSHRFSTVRTADTIVVLDGGRVVQVGSHDELMAAGGLYAELYELQASAYR